MRTKRVVLGLALLFAYSCQMLVGDSDKNVTTLSRKGVRLFCDGEIANIVLPLSQEEFKIRVNQYRRIERNYYSVFE